MPRLSFLTQFQPGINADNVDGHLRYLVGHLSSFYPGIDVRLHSLFPELFLTSLLLFGQLRPPVTIELTRQVVDGTGE